jgi:hypothetical protein
VWRLLGVQVSWAIPPGSGQLTRGHGLLLLTVEAAYVAAHVWAG